MIETMKHIAILNNNHKSFTFVNIPILSYNNGFDYNKDS